MSNSFKEQSENSKVDRQTYNEKLLHIDEEKESVEDYIRNMSSSKVHDQSIGDANTQNFKAKNIAERSSSFIELKKSKIQITWENVTITAPPIKQFCKKLDPEIQDFTILDDISGTVKPGQFLAIIGASGAGKTTLLNYISGKDPSKNLKKKGRVLINGVDRSQVAHHKYVGYIQQDDLLMQTLSVRECLTFAARMKLPKGTDIDGKVDELIDSLRLQKAANTKIGGPLVKGVSGGERKRTSIGVELITDPSLIVLDEPTTGLDSFTAEIVIQVLRDLAKSGRTVISTIHQPNSDVFSNFDQL